MEKNTLRKNAIEIIRLEIIRGVIEPLAEINQVELSKRFEISRGPIREALSQLSAEGLVELNAYKKVTVTDITRTYVLDLYSTRNIIECFAIKKLISYKNNQNIISQLNYIVDQMREAIIIKDKNEVAELDLKFHRAIIIGTKNKFLNQCWNLLELGVLRCMHRRYRIYDSLDEIIGNHPIIIKTIEDKDITRAEALIALHVSDAAEKILTLWDINEQI